MERTVMAWVGWMALACWGCGDAGSRDARAVDSALRAGAGDDMAAGARDEGAAESPNERAANGSAEPDEAEPSPATPSDAESSDLALIPESNGWSLDEAELYRAKTEAAGEIAERLDAERPDVYVGSAIGPEPSDPPRVYIKGVADPMVYEITGAAPFEIRVIDRQPYSRRDIDQRQSLLVDELIALGFLNFGVGTDIQRQGLMEATVQRTMGAPSSADEVLAALPAALRERTSITLVDEPVYVYN